MRARAKKKHLLLRRGGIERKFFPIGKTTLFGSTSYPTVVRPTVSSSPSRMACPQPLIRIFSYELQMLGGGVVQGIDAAAMSLYVYYRRVEADFELNGPRHQHGIADSRYRRPRHRGRGGIIKF